MNVRRGETRILMDVLGDQDFADAVLAHHHQHIQRETIDVAQHRQNKTNKDQCKVKSTVAFTICHEIAEPLRKKFGSKNGTVPLRPVFFSCKWQMSQVTIDK